MKILIICNLGNAVYYKDICKKLEKWNHVYKFFPFEEPLNNYDGVLFLEDYKEPTDKFNEIYNWCKKNGVLVIEKETLNILDTIKVKLRDFLPTLTNKANVRIYDINDKELYRSKDFVVEKKKIESIMNWYVVDCSVAIEEINNKRYGYFRIIIDRK